MTQSETDPNLPSPHVSAGVGRSKRWREFLWPLGGTVLGLLVVPVAIEQYPEIFKESQWILPVSMATVAVCWIAPLLLPENAARLWACGRLRLGPALTVIAILLIIVSGCAGLKKLYDFHVHHLESRLAKGTNNNTKETSKAPMAMSSPAPSSSAPPADTSIPHPNSTRVGKASSPAPEKPLAFPPPTAENVDPTLKEAKDLIKDWDDKYLPGYYARYNADGAPGGIAKREEKRVSDRKADIIEARQHGWQVPPDTEPKPVPGVVISIFNARENERFSKFYESRFFTDESKILGYLQGDTDQDQEDAKNFPPTSSTIVVECARLKRLEVRYENLLSVPQPQ